MGRSTLRLGGLVFAGLLVLTGCGDDGASAGPRTYDVDGVDYGFENLPETVEAGSTLRFTNRSAVEAHELVAIRIPDGEGRSVEELIQLPEEEIEAIFGSAPPAMVLIAGPGDEGTAVVGDGTLTRPIG